MRRLENKVAVVTGGNSGIGLATAQAFVAEGAKVMIVGRRAEAVGEAVAKLGGAAAGFVGDTADVATHRAVADKVEREFGGADIYVANAGVINVRQSSAVTADDYDNQFAVNARGVFMGVQRIAPILRDGGSIVLVSSIASQKVLEGHAVYAGAKAAMEAFARSWALELAARRVRVNVLSPGPTDTPILSKLGIQIDDLSAFEDDVSATIPLGRLGRAEDMARAAVFLASDDARFITGANLPVDGGLSLT